MTAQKKPTPKKSKTAAQPKRPSAGKKQSARKKTASLTASDRRRREVRRYRFLLGFIVLAVIMIVTLALILPAVFRRSINRGQLVGVNSDVMQYEEAVTARCKEYHIEEFSTLMMALMQQESSGQGTDIFQCSESPFNTLYENSPGSITDVDYSIQVGVETFAYCLDMAHCKHISNLDALKIALQEYNFGNNYAEWVLNNYGSYSEENALEFSEMMKAELGWETYGDPQYVEHVLQYITF